MSKLGPNQFQCAACGAIYDKGRSDEVARAEQHENFPGVEDDDCDVVCDDCFHQMKIAGLF